MSRSVPPTECAIRRDRASRLKSTFDMFMPRVRAHREMTNGTHARIICVDLLNDLGATALCIGAGIQSARAADGISWSRSRKRVTFATGWHRDVDMWGWVAVFLGALGVAIAAW